MKKTERIKAYYRKRYHDMKHGKRPLDKTMLKSIDLWAEKTAKELEALDRGMHEGVYIQDSPSTRKCQWTLQD